MQTHMLYIGNLCKDDHFDFEDYDGAFGLASSVEEKYLQARQPPPATRARPPVAPRGAIAPVTARDLAASVVPNHKKVRTTNNLKTMFKIRIYMKTVLRHFHVNNSKN